MPKTASIAPKPRLIYTIEQARSGTKTLTSKQLSDLRVYTGAYIIHVLTTPAVAGAISQTNMFDYRVLDDSPSGAAAHYGPPLSSIEFKLVDTPSHKSTDDHPPEGQLVAEGPAVAGGSTAVDGIMKITENNTLSYAQ